MTTPHTPDVPAPVRGGRSQLKLLVRGTIRHRSGAVGVVLVGLWVAVAIFAPWLAPADPNVQVAGNQLMGVGTPGFPLGSDELGRDILSRVIYGARISIGVGMLAVSCGAAVGTILGLLAGYIGRFVDTALMRLTDIMLAYPGILFGVVVVAILGQGVGQVGVAIAIINVPVFARLARSSVLRERELEYVAAAELLGCAWYRILFRHILPNSVGPAVVQFSVAMTGAVLIEAALSFLGLGAQPPTASWGAMLSTSREFLSVSATYAIFPGLALATLLLGLNLLADGLRSAMDPFRGDR